MFSIFLFSCIRVVVQHPIIQENYDKLDEKDKRNIIFLKENEKISDIKTNNKIYAINAKHFQDFMSLYDSCVVYVWTAHCSSKTCVHPSVYQKYCDDNNCQLLIIAESYDFPEIYQIINLLNNPIFVINGDHYKTHDCKKGIKLFRKELLGESDNKKNGYSRFWFFVNGEFQYFINQHSIQSLLSDKK